MRHAMAILVLCGCYGSDPEVGLTTSAAEHCGPIDGMFSVTYQAREGNCADRTLTARVSSAVRGALPHDDLLDCALLDPGNAEPQYVRSFYPTVSEDHCEHRLVANCAVRDALTRQRIQAALTTTELRVMAGGDRLEGTMELELLDGDRQRLCQGAGDVVYERL